MSQRNCHLVIGSGGGIANAAVQSLLQQHPDDDVLAISRQLQSLPAQVRQLVCDASEDGIQQALVALEPWQGRIRNVLISSGVLHTETLRPEKRAEDLRLASLMDVLRINTAVPAMWLCGLINLLRGADDCHLFVLSARVGSIADNHKGGWYSYRASKAALNMVVKTGAIEYARRAPNVKIIAFHPGTVDTKLSRPYQRNMPPDKLFSAEFAAQRLLALRKELKPDGEASFMDWDGKSIEW